MFTKDPIPTLLTVLLFFMLSVISAGSVVAQDQQPSSDLLLPYFEVDLSGFQLTTSLQLGNAGNGTAAIRMEVFSNWGIPVLTVDDELAAGQIAAYNLRDWLMLGRLPHRTLTAEELAHVQAALTGQASPDDNLYYGTEVQPDKAVGYVTIRMRGLNRDDSLWGSYFVIDPSGNSAQADVLANIDPAMACQDVCMRHMLFFLEGGGFDGGTEMLVWTGRRGQPSALRQSATQLPEVEFKALSPDGEPMETVRQGGLSVQAMSLDQLGIAAEFGSLDITALDLQAEESVPSFIAVRYTAENRFSVAFQSWCLPPVPVNEPPDDPRDDNPGIDIEKATNGHDADQPTGPVLEVGDPVEWTYLVRNTGDVPLSNVTVTDDDPSVSVSCSRTTLGVGASMTCTAQGVAQLGQYSNLGTVTGDAPDGTRVSDEDPSHYLGEEEPVPPAPVSIDIEKATNGHDADVATGPELLEGSAVQWTYVVTNTGEAALSNVAVTDDDVSVSVSCPKTSLAVGESMTCTAQGVAELGQYRNVGTATGRGPENEQVSDDDPSHYYGYSEPEPPALGIHIEKATNGHDADVPTGPNVTVGDVVEWTYVVTNTGEAALSNVTVTDDDPSVSVSCPGSTLAVGDSMICSAVGIAVEGQYANVGTATGDGPEGGSVSDDDPSHYYGEPPVEACGVCEGKVTRLTFRHLGASSVQLRIAAKRGPETLDVFDATVGAGESFEIVGPAHGNGGFAGTLGTEIRLYVNGVIHTSIHTSCSAPIGPGLVFGSFEVLEGESSQGGVLCAP